MSQLTQENITPTDPGEVLDISEFVSAEKRCSEENVIPIPSNQADIIIFVP